MGLAERYRHIRHASLAPLTSLSDEDCAAQAMPDASPLKWHLAHTTWFFETLVLARFAPHTPPFDPAFGALFNSYYLGIGEPYPRARRGLLTRPALRTVLDWREQVDARMQQLLQAGPAPDALVELGLQHEQQH